MTNGVTYDFEPGQNRKETPFDALMESTPRGEPEDLHVDLVGRRVLRGLSKRQRKDRWPEMFRHGFSKDLIDVPPCPPENIQAEFKEILGSEPDYLLRLHPWWKRWTGWERLRGAQFGEGVYRPFCPFMEEPVAGHLPIDLRTEDGRYHALTGLIGDYRLPTKRDFEFIRQLDRRNGVDAVDEALEKGAEAELAEKERVMAAREYDLLDYHYLAINRAANSGVRQYAFRDEELAAELAAIRKQKFREVEKNGYRIRFRHGSRADLADLEEQARLRAEQEATAENLEAAAVRRERSLAAKAAITPGGAALRRRSM